MGRRVVWRDFFEAREYIRSLGLKSSVGWRVWCRSGARPVDIPSNPDREYKEFWRGFPDWLGAGKAYESRDGWYGKLGR